MRGARNRGFTLIEVMVALAIVAVTLGAGIRAAGALTNNADRLAQVTQAQWCAENRLAVFPISRSGNTGILSLPDIGDEEFSCEQLGRSYRGKLVVRPTPNPGFRRVDAEMSNEAGEHLLTISTIVGRR